MASSPDYFCLGRRGGGRLSFFTFLTMKILKISIFNKIFSPEAYYLNQGENLGEGAREPKFSNWFTCSYWNDTLYDDIISAVLLQGLYCLWMFLFFCFNVHGDHWIDWTNISSRAKIKTSYNSLMFCILRWVHFSDLKLVLDLVVGMDSNKWSRPTLL